MPNFKAYFDHNATTPPSPLVKELIPRWIEAFGNPSSIHWGGRLPKTLIREARKNFAALIEANPLEVVFTSGGSEANNLAIKGLFFSLKKQNSPRNHFVFTNIEHPSVTHTMEFLRSMGADVEVFPVGPEGRIDLEKFRNILKPTTALVSAMLANNETGVLLPITEMVQMTHEMGALFHSDCVQALGKIPLSVQKLGVDMASFAGHKFYTLKGVGALYLRKGLIIESLIHGGGHERHRRAGTENAMAIASLGLMASEVSQRLEGLSENMESLRDYFEVKALNQISNVQITSKNLPRLPNTSSLVLEGVEGETLLMNLDLEGFAISTGAACSSGSTEPSGTLLAMGLTRGEAQSSLRVSMGWGTTKQEVDALVATLSKVVSHIRSFPKRELDLGERYVL